MKKINRTPQSNQLTGFYMMGTLVVKRLIGVHRILPTDVSVVVITLFSELAIAIDSSFEWAMVIKYWQPVPFLERSS